MLVGLLQTCKEKNTKQYRRICSRWESVGLPSIFHHQSKDLEDPSSFAHYPWKELALEGWCWVSSLNPSNQWSMSSPSTRILPLEGSTNRNKALISVVFPLPVLPTTPTLVPSSKVQVISLRTNGAFGRYLIWKPTKRMNSCSQFHPLQVKMMEVAVWRTLRNLCLTCFLTFKACNSILPIEGHDDGGLLSSTIAGGSDGMCMNCLIRSTEMR